MLKPYKLTVAETSAFLRRVARRVCHALSPIANITTGVLLANSKFDEASLTLLAALSVSVLIGYLENDFSQE